MLQNRSPAESSPSTAHRLNARQAPGQPDTDFLVADMTSTDDPFEEFEVESGSEKEFLISNLKNDAPQGEVVQFRGARKALPANYSSNVQEWDTTMNQKDFDETVRTARVSDTDFGGQDWQEFRFLQTATPAEIDARIYELILREQDEAGQTTLPSLEYPAPYLVLQKQVEEFARSHIFTVNKHIKPTTLQRREFTRDIYDYARAIGMGRHQANIEVMRARAAYRRERGLTGGLRLDESDDDSTLGLEINDAVEYITSMKIGMQCGPVDPAGAWDEITRLQAKLPHLDPYGRKRKRDMLDSQTINRAMPAARRHAGDVNSRASMKHKRRKLKQRHSTDDNQEPAAVSDVPPIPKSRKERKKAMRRKRLSLNKLEGSMGVKPEDSSPGNTASEFAPTRQLGAEHADEGDGEIGQENPISTKSGKPVGMNGPEKLQVETGTGYNRGIHEDAGGDSWDLRRKKKKKRKRKKIDSSANNAGSLAAKTKAEPDDSNTNLNILKPPPNPHGREVGKTFAEHEKEIFMGHIANENGLVKPQSEPMSTNSNKKIQGRRDRGTRKKKITPTPDASTSTAIEAVKDHHS